MARENAFQVEGVVIKTLPNGTYRVRLRNGHELCAFAPGRARASVSGGLAAGERVHLQLSPYDLSVGRILVESKKIEL